MPYVLEVRPSSEFNYEAAKRKLIDLRIRSDAGSQTAFITPGDSEFYDDVGDSHNASFTSRQGRLLRLLGQIDFDSRLSVGCTGAVLTYLQRRKAAEYLPGDVNAELALRISTVEVFSLKDMM